MKFVIYAFCLIGLIHLGNVFFGPIIRNHMLEGKMISLSEESRLKADEYLMKDLMDFVTENHIEVEKRQIALAHPTPKAVLITAKYDVYCKFWFLEKSYEFTASSATRPHGIFPNFSAYF